MHQNRRLSQMQSPNQVAQMANEILDTGIDSYFVEEDIATGKYDDDDIITCRTQFKNNRICGRKFRNMGDFIKHLRQANVHKKLMEEE